MEPTCHLSTVPTDDGAADKLLQYTSERDTLRFQKKRRPAGGAVLSSRPPRSFTPKPHESQQVRSPASGRRGGYLVDPASSICLSQRLSHASLSTHGRYSETANGSLNQLWFLWSLAPLLLG